MKKIALYSLLIIGLFANMSCLSSKNDLIPSDEVVKKTVDVGSFNEIYVSNSIEVILQQGEQKIIVEANENLHPYIYVKEQNKVLNLELNFNGTIRGGHKIKIYVYTPEVKLLTVRGASKVSVKGELSCKDLFINVTGASSLKGKISGEKLNISVTGASRADIKMNFSNLKATVTGASNADFNGKIHSGNINISGASDLDADGLTIEKLNIVASGASSTKVKATKVLSYHITGASKLFYSGNPKLESTTIDGGSTVRKK